MNFGWIPGAGVVSYDLAVGTQPNWNDLAWQTGLTTTNQQVVIPGLGSKVFASLYSHFAQGDILVSSAVYDTAALGDHIPFSLIAPQFLAPTFSPSGQEVTLHWNGGSGASEYWLFVGTAAYLSNIYSSRGAASDQTAATISNIPAGVHSLYASLWTSIKS